MDEKAKNRKPLGRHITKGNFDDIMGGPDIESIQIPEDYGQNLDDWDDEDFASHQAAMQFNIKCLYPNASITPNLMGRGDEVFDLALDENGECPIDDLQNLYNNELKITRPTEVSKSNQISEDKHEVKQPSLFGNFSVNTKDLDLYINWKVLVPLCIAWQLLAGPVYTFLINLLPFAILKLGYDYFKTLLNPSSKLDTTTFVNTVSNVLDGKALLMKAFQNGDEKVIGEERSYEIIQDQMSTASTCSRAFVHSLGKLNIPLPPPSIMSENELEVPVSRQRVYTNVIFNNVMEVNCLIDLGATSCSVNRSILDIVEKRLQYKLPRLKRTFPVMAFAQNHPKQQECVVMDISVGDATTKNVPFLVNEADSKVVALIGINVIRHWGADISISNDKDVIEFKHNIVPHSNITPSTDRKNLDVVVAKQITMFPMETTTIPAKIVGKLHPKFGNDFLCHINSSDLVSTPFIFKRRGDKDQLNISCVNNSSVPITLSEGIQIGEISTFNQDTFKPENNVLGLAEKAFFFKHAMKTIECLCDLVTDRSVPLIIFTDKYGISPHFRQLTAGNLPLKDHEKMKPYRQDLNVIYVKQKDGKYPFDWSILQNLISKKARIAISFRQQLSEIENFLDQLRRKNIMIHIYSVQNIGCIGCMSLANRDCPELFTNIDQFKIFLINGGTQPEDFQRLKDAKSPVIEMEIGYYCHLQAYRCQGSLIIYVHFTKWHDNNHKFRVENTVYTLFSHLRILQVPQNCTILTSWDDMSCQDSIQIKSALEAVEPWTSNPEFKINVEDLKSSPKVAPFVIRRCGCQSCLYITEGKICRVKKAVMVFSGMVPNEVSSTCRVKENDLQRKLGIRLLEIFEQAAEVYVEKLKDNSELLNGKMEHPDDQPNWHGQEEIQELMNNWHGELDADTILKDRHVPKPWRTTLDEKSFDRLGAQNKSLLVKILDRYNDMFSHFKGSWRYMDVEPLELEFIHDTPVVSRPIQMSPIKDRILTSKVMNLIEHDLVKILEVNPKMVTNISNLFLVPHNSSCQREILTGKRDPNQVENIDPSKFRAVVDLREANTTIKNPTQLNFVIESTCDLLNRLAPFKSFILMDISAAYRSFPVTERTARRFAFRANTAQLRNKILAFSSLTDGISVAPSVFSHTILKILEPINQHCLVWIDDVLLMANSDSEALKIFEKALDLLEKANVLINIKKLVILEPSFEYLGFQITITPEGPKLSVPNSKKEIFQRMEMPTTRDGIRRILGMVTFIDLMIPGLHCHFGPLIDQLKTSVPTSKKKPIEITDIHRRSFNKITKLLDNLQDVHLFRYDQTAYLVTDASLTAAGACLFQLNPDGTRRIIAYYSKRFSTIIQCQKASIFKEILALFFGINHFFKPYLVGAIKIVLICDLSCIITLLSANYNPVDPVLSRLSFKLFSFGFSFQLRHAPANKDILISDQLSRLHEEPVSFTGLPIRQMRDSEKIFQEFEKKIPKKWISGAEFNYQDMINHLTSEILKDPKISENVRQKRFSHLLQQIDEKWHPPILQFVKQGTGKDTEVIQTKTLKADDDLEVSLIQCKGDRYVDLKVNIMATNVGQNTKLTPPRSIKALNVSHLVRMQREDEQCNKVIQHLLTVPREKQDPKFKKQFRLLDSNLLVTRKSAKQPWTESNLRIYLPISAAFYVLAYLHLVSAHIGQNYLAQMFSATYKCFNLTKMVKIIGKTCSHCQIYEHKNMKFTKPGRLPRASRPSERVYMDILTIPPGKLQNKTYKHILGILDDFSGFLNLIPLKDQTTNTVLKELSKLWSTLPTPSVVITDNASNFKTFKFREPLMNMGVQKVLTTSPNHSTSNSRIERAFKTVRRILFLNLSTFKRESHWDVFYSSLAQFNNTPSWRLAKFTSSRVPASPMELFYSQPCTQNILDELLGHLNFSQQNKYKEVYKKIVEDFDDDQEKQHNLEIKDMKVGKSLDVGDIVMVMNPKRIHHEGEAKGKELYLRDLWEIIDINHSKATISPLFFKSRKCERVFLDHLKKYEPQMLVQILPEEMQALMGHYHNPEVLKRTRRPPSVFERKIPLANFPSLRGRIDPEDNHSIPAIRGLIHEEDDFDDYDDPLFPRPGPDYTQIKYQKMIIPEDPNLAPQGQANGNDDAEEEEQVEDGAEEDANDVTVPGNATAIPAGGWEIKDHTLQPDSPNTVVNKIKNLANQTENQNDTSSRRNVTFNDKYFRRTYELPKEEKKFKQGKVPNWDPNKATKSNPNQQETKTSVLGKVFGGITNLFKGNKGNEPDSFQNIARQGQQNLAPFQPQHESSPQRPGYQYEEGNAWNQFSPVPNRSNTKPSPRVRRSILKNSGNNSFNQTLNDTMGETDYPLPNDSWDNTQEQEWRSQNNDSTLTGRPPPPSPKQWRSRNSPNNTGNTTLSPNVVAPPRPRIPLNRTPRGNPPPPSPQFQTQRMNTPVRQNQVPARRIGTPHPNPIQQAPPNRLRRPLSMPNLADDSLTNAFQNLGTSTPAKEVKPQQPQQSKYGRKYKKPNFYRP